MAMGVDPSPPANCRELKWQLQLTRRSVNEVVLEVAGDRCAEVRLRLTGKLSGTTGRHAQSEQA